MGHLNFVCQRLMIAVFVVLGCAAVAALGSSCGGAAIWIQFPTREEPVGVRSYISHPTNVTQYQMAAGAALPSIVVLVNTVDPMTGAPVPLLSERGFMVGVHSTPNAILFTGAVVAVSEGKAIFRTLTPTVCNATAAYTLIFTLRSEEGAALSVPALSVPVSCSNPFVIGTIEFGETGFITPFTTSTRQLPTGALPAFTIAVYNPFGFLDDRIPTIGVSMSNGQITPSNSPTFSRSSNNLFTVSGINFIPTSSAVVTSTVRVSVIGAPSTVTPPPPLTATFTLVQATRPNYFMQFDTSPSTSFVTSVGQAFTTVAEIPMPPIRILLYDSNMNFDRSTTGIVVTASCAVGTLTGAHAAVVQGTATFASLAFTAGSAPRSAAVITFSASGFASQIATPLFTGAATVTSSPLVASQLQFATRSGLQASTPLTTVLIDSSNNFVIPNVVVLVLDSAARLDTTANNIVLQLQLSADTSAVISSGGAATVSNGVAVFASVLCNNGGEGSTFRVCVTDPTGLRSQLCSGLVALAAATSPGDVAAEIQRCATATSSIGCSYALSLGSAPLSYLYEPGQPLMATLGMVMPEIQLLLHDAFGPISSPLSGAVVPQVIAYTGEHPNAERYLKAEGRVGVWRQTYYSFSCLRFARVPVGFVRISFAAVTSLSTLTPFRWLPTLQSGFVYVAHTLTPAYGIRFAKTNAVFSYAGQSSTAVVNVALPPIRIEFVDSDHAFDDSVDGVVVQATTSSGSLRVDGATEVAVKGVATFRLLTFDAAGIEPMLTFTVRPSSTSTVSLEAAGRSVSTGSILVTTTAIPAASIVFLAARSEANNVSYPFASFVFTSFDRAILKVAVAIADSAHVIAPTAERSVTIKQLSFEGVLAATQEVAISQGAASSAFFDAQFLSAQSGYEDAPVFLRYTVTASSSPLLVGHTIVVGPLFIADKMDRSTCASHFYAPLVVAIFRQPLFAFNASAALLEVSGRLGVIVDQPTTIAAGGAALATTSIADLQRYSPSSRLLLLSAQSTLSSDAVTLTRYTGTKLLLQFRGAPTSEVSSLLTDRSARALAALLINYRPTCTPSSSTPYATDGMYTIQSSTYAFDDATCVSSVFDTALANARNCSLGGFLTVCQCYALYAMEPYGGICALVPSLEATFTALCSGTLLGCSEASVSVACESYAPPAETSTLVYLALLALVTLPIAGVVYCCYKRATSNKVLMNAEKQTEMDAANEPIIDKVKRLVNKALDAIRSV